MLVDKFRKLGFDIDNRVEIRENEQYGKHICAFKTIEKGDFESSTNKNHRLWTDNSPLIIALMLSNNSHQVHLTHF